MESTAALTLRFCRGTLAAVLVSKNGVLETEEVTNELAYARQVDAFAAAVEGKAPAEEGWRNQLVLDAAS